ncbi:MAG: hypothetical protein A3F82_07255 [Deltaproteobacteria bacterium RIFCSPLOWO2_12_FULL_44_12]|nr:MAG: hypothetical protein A2712_10090 [Deltaproteobacteria bacterium RIFCSPHIGHO2_01_FULL_43_49]OGQ15460.1 MAG: hypothetical protein A3D22_10620 [Deltaproteobacteria bacterium RIFCSPHIGHO2_02_FULL_44_53]OGQ29653.1 MAG: hypothetical protein A3D98_10820 [Deltaproteobacteria bacterium RIFCSPHIGHO2_12_FULL_44_21]OGQ32266.1 MAG: hypothetical protein A2979_00465 [Deltaproteobacteria bacterium RIFCSPLOWO2_01_FULL_45_74]OGQ43909.1 MAG: hypothetical protein A3I70_04365 [Deltaproteobacteria bacterium 
MAQYHSAERVQTKTGKQYHIGLGPGDLAPYILLCGDPGRVQKVAKYFKKKKAAKSHREYVTVTGTYEGIPISVMSTGIGPDNTEIALVEISQIVKQPTFIRIGSCGGLKKGMEIGDLVVSTGAVRLENTTSFFVCDGYPAVAHYEIVSALVQAAKGLKVRHHVGITATAPGFYGAQGRTVPGFASLDPDLPKKLEKMNVINMEMETSCLLVLSSLMGCRAGAVCAVYANRHANRFIDNQTMKRAEKHCIETGLEAMKLLAQGG